MTKAKRAQNIIVGIVMILCALMMAMVPESGYTLVVAILCIILLTTAIRKIMYYFQMARYMVGGGVILAKGLIELDLAVFVYMLTDVPSFYVMLYLIVGLLFSGIVDIMTALESRKLENPSWKFQLAEGGVSLILSIVCFMYFQSIKIAVYVFCISIIQSAILKIAEACKQTAVIYIP